MGLRCVGRFDTVAATSPEKHAMSTEDPFDFSAFRPSAPPMTGAAPGTPPPMSPAFGSVASPWPQSPAGSGSGDQFGSMNPQGSRSEGAVTSVSKPLVWLWISLAAIGISLVLGALPFSGGAMYILGWVLAGPVAFLTLTIFARRDADGQSMISYSYPAWQPKLYTTAWILAVAAILLNAFRIAVWVGHL